MYPIFEPSSIFGGGLVDMEVHWPLYHFQKQSLISIALSHLPNILQAYNTPPKTLGSGSDSWMLCFELTSYNLMINGISKVDKY